MATLRFTTTRLSGLRAAGQVGKLQHAVIAPFLRRELGERFGRLFADFEAEGSDLRAWYVEAGAPPRRAADLPAAERDAVLRTAGEMVLAVRALADRIAGESAARADLARTLVAATTFPEEDVWCVGAEPVIVNWGFHRQEVSDGAPRAIMDLVALPGPQPLSAAAPEPVPSHRAPPRTAMAAAWRLLGRAGPPALWLLLVGLLTAIDKVLLPACGLDGHLRPLAGWHFLDACAATSPARDAAEEGARLRDLVRQAELQVAERRQICAATPDPAPVSPRAADPAVERRLPPEAPRGDAEISLLWDGHADLDLIVDCPDGNHLSQSSPGLQACGGRLLQDVNRAGGPLRDDPIEHAAFRRPAPGTYRVRVELYGYNDAPADGDVPFTVRVRRGADVRPPVTGHVKGGHSTAAAIDVTF